MAGELLPPKRCICPCHEGSVGDRHRADGVSVTDPIEAACACPTCLNNHADALLSMRLANAPAPRIVDRVTWVDPEPPKPIIDDEDGG